MLITEIFGAFLNFAPKMGTHFPHPRSFPNSLSTYISVCPLPQYSMKLLIAFICLKSIY